MVFVNSFNNSSSTYTHVRTYFRQLTLRVKVGPCPSLHSMLLAVSG